jgi:hypothetical protein
MFDLMCWSFFCRSNNTPVDVLQFSSAFSDTVNREIQSADKCTESLNASRVVSVAISRELHFVDAPRKRVDHRPVWVFESHGSLIAVQYLEQNIVDGKL